ncbi:hypothetical protein OH76DRAFT_436281 [Lentinus brumalis]|uniref:Uncharacterized protein n=1 Tax=Lentinus brumalis TaxID=2498619 RepID=A0A371DDV6_9APHY|nr:hypothetical protein OH76DRAFT_436281 [Polyporus brumalis]
MWGRGAVPCGEAFTHLHVARAYPRHILDVELFFLHGCVAGAAASRVRFTVRCVDNVSEGDGERATWEPAMTKSSAFPSYVPSSGGARHRGRADAKLIVGS